MTNPRDFEAENPKYTEEDYEEAAELFDDADIIIDHDLATEEQFNTQDGDGHTYNPHIAAEDGLTYTPPQDPPVIVDDDGNTVVATGFGTSMERNLRNDPYSDDDLPTDDEEIAAVVRDAIRMNSETQNLDKIKVRVRDGVVTLTGIVPDDQDKADVDDIVREIAGVVDVTNKLDTEY